MLDPLDVFLKERTTDRGMVPIPLISTDYEIVITAGLAVITCHRLFRNAEHDAIEAVMTFPVPLKATLFALEANIDGRILKAAAQESWRARNTYEEAIARGKSAVLHEELLRGIHTLSVANLGSGSQIQLSATWAMPLTVTGKKAILRVPQSVGDVYGRSPLPDAIALTTGAPSQPVLVSVKADTHFDIVGATRGAGRLAISSALPIEIVCDLWAPQTLTGATTSGQRIELTLSPTEARSEPVDVAVLLDRSGSMGGLAHPGQRRTAHQLACAGLHALADQIEKDDRVQFWEFSDLPRRVGQGSDPAGPSSTQRRAALHEQLLELAPPEGGTETGRAIEAVLNASAVRDVLILTDGQSDALDVSKIAARGHRISVVLIGAGSLEARIGHLATLTGGDVFVTPASEVSDAIAAAYRGLATPYRAPPQLDEFPKQLECQRDGVGMRVTWCDDETDTHANCQTRAIAAVAISMLLPCLPVRLATQTAIAQGLVTHLTSLVMVDEAGDTFGITPVTRKVDLAATTPTPSMEEIHTAIRRIASIDEPVPGIFDDWVFSACELMEPGINASNASRIDHEDGVEEPLATSAGDLLDPTQAGIRGAIEQLSQRLRLLQDQKAAASPTAHLSDQVETLMDEAASAVRDAHVAAVAVHTQLEAHMTFFAQASHELRTPLNAIVGFADIMRSGEFGPLPERYQEYAELIHEGSRNLSLLVDDVLDLARLGADRYYFMAETVCLTDLADEAVRFMAAEASRKSIDLRRSGPDDAEAFADTRAVRQIALNLISNALKFTPAGGSVDVIAEEVPGGAKLTVSDSGVGVSPEERLRLSTAFEQGDAGKKQKGAGLGLSIVRAFADQHGGRLEIERQEGSGARVSVFFPACPPANAPAVLTRLFGKPLSTSVSGTEALANDVRTKSDWLSFTAREIDWEECGLSTDHFDLSTLSSDVVAIVDALAALEAVKVLANKLSLSPQILSMAFLASLVADENAVAHHFALGVLQRAAPMTALGLGDVFFTAIKDETPQSLPLWWLHMLPDW